MSAAMAQKKEGLNGMSENEKLEQAADQAADKPAKTDKKKDDSTCLNCMAIKICRPALQYT